MYQNLPYPHKAFQSNFAHDCPYGHGGALNRWADDTEKGKKTTINMTIHPRFVLNYLTINWHMSYTVTVRSLNPTQLNQPITLPANSGHIERSHTSSIKR